MIVIEGRRLVQNVTKNPWAPIFGEQIKHKTTLLSQALVDQLQSTNDVYHTVWLYVTDEQWGCVLGCWLTETVVIQSDPSIRIGMRPLRSIFLSLKHVNFMRDREYINVIFILLSLSLLLILFSTWQMILWQNGFFEVSDAPAWFYNQQI